MFLTVGAIPIFVAQAHAFAMNPGDDPEVLRVEQKGPVVWITLNRPQKCNALNIALNEALARAFQSVPSDAAIVVLRGAGKHFCAGSDLKDLYQVDRRQAEKVMRLEIELCHALAALPQLTVAVLHGKCYGGGAFLPLYCDLRVGRPGMEIALPEVPLGWAPPYGLERLKEAMPGGFALEVLLSGRTCDDQEALARGWVHRLCASEEEASSFIEKLALIPRRTLNDVLGLMHPKNLQEMRHADEEALTAFLDHFDTDYARRTVASFVEKKRS